MNSSLVSTLVVLVLTTLAASITPSLAKLANAVAAFVKAKLTSIHQADAQAMAQAVVVKALQVAEGDQAAATTYAENFVASHFPALPKTVVDAYVADAFQVVHGVEATLSGAPAAPNASAPSAS